MGNVDFQKQAEEKKQQRILRRNGKTSRLKTERFHKREENEEFRRKDKDLSEQVRKGLSRASWI